MRLSIGLKREDDIDRTEWRNAVSELSRNVKSIRRLPLTETKPDLEHWISFSF